jgi:hypothetical protein
MKLPTTSGPKAENFWKKADERFIPLIEKHGHCAIRPADPKKYYIKKIAALGKE